MATVSDVSICSNALLLIGDAPIASLTENNDRARLVANLYESQRNACLRAHPWNFAEKQVLLAPEAEAPVLDWTAKFLLPGDFLRVVQVGEANDRPAYRKIGTRIYFNDSELPLSYIYEVTDPQQFDALFVSMLQARIAAFAAYPITKDRGTQKAMIELYTYFMQEARTVDGIENPPEELDEGSIIRARRG